LSQDNFILKAALVQVVRKPITPYPTSKVVEIALKKPFEGLYMAKLKFN